MRVLKGIEFPTPVWRLKNVWAVIQEHRGRCSLRDGLTARCDLQPSGHSEFRERRNYLFADEDSGSRA